MAPTRELFDSLTGVFGLSTDVLAGAVDALQSCEEVVTACAMGMLGEEDAQQLLPAVSRDLDCADVAGTTRRVLTRHSGRDSSLVVAQLETCLLACERSHELCSRHADHHTHCRLCAEATRKCADVCREVLDTLRG